MSLHRADRSRLYPKEGAVVLDLVGTSLFVFIHVLAGITQSNNPYSEDTDDIGGFWFPRGLLSLHKRGPRPLVFRV